MMSFRKTRNNTTDMDPCERILTEISAKMSTVCDQLKEVSSNVTDITRQLQEQQISNTSMENTNSSKFMVTALKEKIDEMCQHFTGLANYQLLDETNKLKINEEAFKIRRNLREWKTSFNQRKQNFWNSLRTHETSKLFQEYMTEDSQYLPRKFRPQTIPKEPDEQSNERIRLAFETMRSEERILQNKADRYTTKYLKIDENIMNLISQRASGKIREKLEELWTNQCNLEEDKSRKIWEKKANWFKKQKEQEEKNNGGKAPLLKQNTKPAPRSPKQKYGTGKNQNRPRTYAEAVKTGQARAKPQTQNTPQPIYRPHPRNKMARKQNYRGTNSYQKNNKTNSVKPNTIPRRPHPGRQLQLHNKTGNIRINVRNQQATHGEAADHFLGNSNKFRQIMRKQQRRWNQRS